MDNVENEAIVYDIFDIDLRSDEEIERAQIAAFEAARHAESEPFGMAAALAHIRSKAAKEEPADPITTLEKILSAPATSTTPLSLGQLHHDPTILPGSLFDDDDAREYASFPISKILYPTVDSHAATLRKDSDWDEEIPRTTPIAKTRITSNAPRWTAEAIKKSVGDELYPTVEDLAADVERDDPEAAADIRRIGATL